MTAVSVRPHVPRVASQKSLSSFNADDYKDEPMVSYRLLLMIASIACLVAPALAVTEQEAERMARQGDFAQAAAAYRALLAQKPQSVPLRLALANTLARDFQWDGAIAEYEAVLRVSPKNIEALRGIGKIRRWQGHIEQSNQAYLQAQAHARNDPEPVLGLAAVQVLDHNFAEARQLYDQAAKKWPQDGDVRQAAYDFARQTNPRAYVFYEGDLSFTTKQAGLAVPFLARDEVGVDYQQEESFLSDTRARTYLRTDHKLLYTHFFGFNHTVDASVRQSRYTYDQPVTAFSAIDHFDEYRVRYTFPVTPEQIVAVRYAARPTTLKTSGQDFLSHKIEAEITSQWTPRFQTLLGTGWLRDLDANATSTSDMSTNILAKAGFQAVLSSRWQMSAKYITNPDLDNTVNSTRLLQADYSDSDVYSALARVRYDDYKQGADQTAYYLGVRIAPSSHLWSEVGAKYVKRGSNNGTYPLVSLVWRF